MRNKNRFRKNSSTAQEVVGSHCWWASPLLLHEGVNKIKYRHFGEISPLNLCNIHYLRSFFSPAFHLYVKQFYPFSTNWVKACYKCVKLGKGKVYFETKIYQLCFQKIMKDQKVISVQLTCVSECTSNILLKKLNYFFGLTQCLCYRTTRKNPKLNCGVFFA